MIKKRKLRLLNKTALVTGATSGIGREIARRLVDGGCHVLLCGRDKKAMDSLMQELRMHSPSSEERNVKEFLADLSDKKALRELITQVNKDYDLDILVNNAGFGSMTEFHSMPWDKIDSMQEVNMFAVVMLCRAFLPRMVEKSEGGILNVGSIASFFPTPGSALYGATKYFVLSFTDALHQEMLSSGVHVTGIYPGKTQSRFLERATESRMKDWDKAMEPAVVARLALQGLRANKIRVIPGWDNKLKVFIASVLPVEVLLRKTYKNPAKAAER